MKKTRAEIPGSRRSMQGYLVTYSRLKTKGKPVTDPVSQMRGPYFLRPEDPTAGLPHEEVEYEVKDEEEKECSFWDINIPSAA